MCGIIASLDRNEIDKDLFRKMRDTMIHRGPDDNGSYFSKDGKTALGHRRLSIIDLSEHARQPISNEKGTVWLSYNGEIYNFKELRTELKEKGHRFKSETDSEVIVHAYEEWGEACVERLWGMFAFIVWDEKKQQLYGARDRLGVKPLHYYYSGDKFICASEIKAVIKDPNVPRKIDRSALCDFLTYRYIPAPKTIWQCVRKLSPAHAFIYNNGDFRIWRYWELETQDKIISEKEAMDHLGQLLNDAVKRRLVSDVPVGLFLSGGLDSTAISWVMKQLGYDVQSFTIGFEGEKSDETADADIVARHFNTNHHVEFLTDEALKNLSMLFWYFDEPFGASSTLPTFLVSKVAKKKVTVALSGDGGDEAFAGYNWYDSLVMPESSRWLTRLRGKTKEENLAESYRQATTPRFNRRELEHLFVEPLKEVENDELWFFNNSIRSDLSGVKQLQWLDIHTFLPEEVLTKVDRASMSNSLEVRSPFLDHRLYEWVFSLSQKVYHRGEKKHLIKMLLREAVPAAIIKKTKRGFSAPVNLYWSNERVNSYLKHSRAVKDGLFNENFINKLVENSDASSTFAKRWLLMIFEIWYREWVSWN